jgi:hypothetical protein
MRGTIKIGDKNLEMVANGATPFIYKRVFRRDFLATTQTDDLNVYSELAYVMTMQAGGKPMSELLNTLTVDDFYEWVADFEAMDLITAAGDIFALYQGQSQPSSTSKKKK